MSDNTIDGLRAELFATLRALRDPANPIDIERARAVSDLAQTIINSARVEVDAMRAAGTQTGSRFFGTAPPAGTPAGTHTLAERTGLRVTQHRLQG